MDSCKINKINDVTFTSREMDVISCILNVRGVKKIGDILGISPRTVEGHIKNILIKISSNSQEGIKDFVESSPQLVLIKQHYTDLLINKLFLSQIATVAEKLKNKNISCVIDCIVDEKLEYILNCLKLANINIIKKSDNIPVNSQRIIVPLTQEHLLQLKQQRALNNFIFICFDKSLKDDFLQKFSHIQIIDCFQRDQIYSAIFKIIELLAPNIDLNDSISNFNKQKNNVINLKIDFTTRSLNANQEIKEKLLTRKLVVVTACASVVIIVALLSVTLFRYKNNHHISNNIGINFILPNKKILLERKEINDQLDKIFAKSDDINTAVLVGVGGSGKTTIARKYANKRKVSIAWEINAETTNSLFLSLESLAYAICNSNSDKQELRSILDITEVTNKNKQLLLFIQKQLKGLSNWLLIYDNVESFKDILEYFPYNVQGWGNGRVIITTRDATVTSHDIDNLHVISVGEINQKEKLELFNNISGDLLSRQIYTEQVPIEQFLESIPSFPLDVSAVAYYLKATNTLFNKYLENLRDHSVDFEAVQEELQRKRGTYMETRYNIITTSLQHIIDTNKDFRDLAIFISLLDSQNIPKNLLDRYKNNITTDNFIFNLKKYSFITDESSSLLGPTFSIHRNTQAIMLSYLKQKLDLEKNKEILSQIAGVLETYMDELLDKEDYAKSSFLLNHCETFLSRDMLTDEITGSIGVVLGGIYCSLEYSNLKIRPLLEKSLQNLEKYKNKYANRIALALTYLGITIEDRKKSMDLLEQSIAIYKKNKTSSIGFARAMTYLGNEYSLLGDYDKAKNLLQHSIEIYQKHQDNQNVTARAVRYLGCLYRELGDYKKARDLLEQSIKIYPKNTQHIEIVFSMVFLGEIYKELGEYEKAKDLLEKSIAICRNYGSEKYNPYNMGWIKAHLGIIYDKLGDYSKAKNLLEEGFNIYKEYYGESHCFVAWMAVNLGNIYRELGEYEKAKDLLEHSLIIHKHDFRNGHVDIGWNLLYLGKLYSNLGDFKNAKDLLEQSIAIYKNHYGDDNIQVARGLGALGENYLLEGKFETAEPMFNQAKEIMQKAAHPEIRIPLELLGDLFQAKSELVKNSNNEQFKDFKFQSANYYKQAVEFGQSTLPNDSIHLIRLKQKISR